MGRRAQSAGDVQAAFIDSGAMRPRRTSCITSAAEASSRSVDHAQRGVDRRVGRVARALEQRDHAGAAVQPSGVSVEESFESGDSLIQRSPISFTNPRTRASVSTSVVEIYTLRAGKLARCDVYFKDTYTAPLVALCSS